MCCIKSVDGELSSEVLDNEALGRWWLFSKDHEVTLVVMSWCSGDNTTKLVVIQLLRT